MLCRSFDCGYVNWVIGMFVMYSCRFSSKVARSTIVVLCRMNAVLWRKTVMQPCFLRSEMDSNPCWFVDGRRCTGCDDGPSCNREAVVESMGVPSER